MHLILLLTGIVIWIVFCWIEGISKARNRYLLNAPELIVVKNGIRWLREHNLNNIRYLRIGLVYILVITVMAIYLSFNPIEYSRIEDFIFIATIILIPICFFPYFHDTAYYQEYNRLAKVGYEESWFCENKIAANIIQLAKRERFILLTSGLGMLICELVIYLT